MASRTANFVVRAWRFVPVVACLFSGCTCSGGPAPQPATPTAIRRTPTVAPAAPTKTAVPVVPTEVPPTVATPEVVPTAPPTEGVSRSQSDCERYVAALSGRGSDAALLKEPAVKALALRAPDLTICGAVASDSEALCALMSPASSEVDCSRERAIYHELRAHPETHAFAFTEFDLAECLARKFPPPADCNAVREAVVAGDVAKCAKAGDLQFMCSTLISLDKSSCGHAKVPENVLRRLAERVKVEVKDLAGECEKQVDEKIPLAKGLKGLSTSGSSPQREFANAALGHADACAPYAKAAMKACLEEGVLQPGTSVTDRG